MMTKFIITELGFNSAVRCVAGVIGFTALVSFFFCVPNPRHIFRKPETWKRVDVWLDPGAFANPAFNWFTAGICFVFLGFYVVFFNLEEVRARTLIRVWSLLTVATVGCSPWLWDERRTAGS